MNIVNTIGSILTAVFVGIASIGQTIFIVPKTPPAQSKNEQPTITQFVPQNHGWVPNVVQPTAIPTKPSVQKPIVDADPIITCTFTHIAPRQLKKSVCSQSTDCEIGGNWYYYESRSQCTNDQNKYWQGRINNIPKPAPYVVTPPIITPPTFTYTPYIPTQEDLNAMAQTRQQEIDACKRDCILFNANMIGAGFYGNPDEKLTDSQYAEKEAQVNKNINRCKADCER